MTELKASVVIATYNGEKYIKEQANTILEQTRLPDEVLISDDCSKDHTLGILTNYIEKNNLSGAWKIHINEKNKGYAKNFLDAALLAEGDIVFFCDQDDLWSADRIEKMAAIMETHSDINLLCSNLEPFYYESDTRKWSKNELKAMTNDGSLERPMFDASNFHLKRSGCTMCIRKNFLKEIIPFWKERWAHDDFVWKMAVASDSCAVIQYCSMKRRMHSNNATVIRERTREGRMHQLDDTNMQYESLKKYIKKVDGNQEKISIVDKNIDSIKIRRHVVGKRHIWEWPILYFKYHDCYPRIKGLYLDLYFSIFKKYKGAN